jgi:hypothetical protein
MAAKAHARDCHVSQVSYLVELHAEVGEDREVVLPKASNPTVAAVGTALQLQIQGGELDVSVGECQERIKVAPVEGVEGSLVQLDVLLRHQLLRKPGGFEGSGLVREKLPSDDPASVEGPYLGESLLEGSSAALSAASFAHDDHNARTCVSQLLRIEAVIVPRAPVMARSLDNRISPDIHAVEVQDRKLAQVPDDVFVQQRPEDFDVLNSALNQLHVLLRHRPAQYLAHLGLLPELQFAPRQRHTSARRRGRSGQP